MRKIEHWDNDDEGTWAVSYGDMITLLLSFFVIYFSFDFKDEKEKKLEKEVMSSINQVSETKPAQSLKPISIEKNTAVNTDGIFSDNDYIIEKVSSGMFVIVFKNTSFFNSGSLKIQEEAQKKLSQFTKTFLPFSGKYHIKIKAFTDNVPVRKNSKNKFSDNLELSTLRSLNVMRFLTKEGIPMRRIEISGTGVISKNFEKYLGITNKQEINKKALSRTVALVIKRDEDQG
jgi:chemotaxis protein MotB